WRRERSSGFPAPRESGSPLPFCRKGRPHTSPRTLRRPSGGVHSEPGGLVTLFLAVGAAAAYGAGDFFGGGASRRADPLHVGAISQIAGLLLGLLMLPFLGTSAADSGQLAWAVAGGVSGGLALAIHRDEWRSGAPIMKSAPDLGR